LSIQTYVTDKFQYLKNHPSGWVRIGAGILLVIGGIFGALPVLGFWMLPLGLILLSADFPWAKRLLVNIKLLFRRVRNRNRRRNRGLKTRSNSEPQP
jgi:hypothetical protein